MSKLYPALDDGVLKQVDLWDRSVFLHYGECPCFARTYFLPLLLYTRLFIYVHLEQGRHVEVIPWLHKKLRLELYELATEYVLQEDAMHRLATDDGPWINLYHEGFQADGIPYAIQVPACVRAWCTTLCMEYEYSPGSTFRTSWFASPCLWSPYGRHILRDRDPTLTSWCHSFRNPRNRI
jgi:hypothetical protein